MAEIVTVRERWDADPILKAVENAYNYVQAMDDAHAVYSGRHEYVSVLGAALAEAVDLMLEILAAEREEEFEADYPEVSQAEFNSRFTVKDDG